MWSVKCGVWSFSLACEERSVKCEVWGLECEGSSEKWEVWSVKCGVWSVECEVSVWSAKSAVWSVKCEVWSVKEAVRSEKCEVWSVKFQFGVRRGQCEVWSVECEVWSVKEAVRSEKCEVWSVECEVWSLECEECSVKCGVWSVKTLLRLSLKKSNGCRGKDTVGTGCLWTIGHLCLGNFRRRLARVYVSWYVNFRCQPTDYHFQIYISSAVRLRLPARLDDHQPSERGSWGSALSNDTIQYLTIQ